LLRFDTRHPRVYYRGYIVKMKTHPFRSCLDRDREEKKERAVRRFLDSILGSSRRDGPENRRINAL
jgi:hypothetical protein